MKVVFIDPTGLDYDARTPLERPLGGTQSAIAYLAVELSRQGVEVAIANGVSAPRNVEQVRFIRLRELDGPLLNEFDVVIVSTAADGIHYRGKLGVTRPLVLWCHLPPEQPAAQNLRHDQERAAWTAFVMVSTWQLQRYAATFPIPAAKMTILRNGVAPCFLTTEPQAPWFARGEGPQFAYTSTPYRGLGVLLFGFPTIRKSLPTARLKLFSDMTSPDEREKHRVLHDLAGSLPGVEYVGSVGQQQLATDLASLSALTYPNTFAETACIAVMEAIACGALVCATDNGAIPETSGHYGHLLRLSKEHYSTTRLAQDYADHVVRVVQNAERHPSVFMEKRAKQIAHARSNYDWSKRAVEWVQFLEGVRKA